MIITLIGPSGSGKSTIEKEIVSVVENSKKVISHTSRKKREGEIDGIDYHFVDKDFFIKNKEDFLEFVEFGGNYYGVFKDSLHLDKINVIVVEPEGDKQISKKAKEFGFSKISIILTISKESQKKRMLERGDSEEMINKRLSFDDIENRSKELNPTLVINTEIVSIKEAVDLIKMEL